MSRNLVSIVLLIGMCIGRASEAQQFYASNVRSIALGAQSAELIIFDYQTANYSTIGVIGENLGLTDQYFDGLAWSGSVGSSPLIGCVSSGTFDRGFFEIDPVTADATFLEFASEKIRDIAWDPVNSKMYGIGPSGVWRDDDGDMIPETLLTDLFVGWQIDFRALGIDHLGRLFVVDRERDHIYRVTGNSTALWYTFPRQNFVPNQGVGLCLKDGIGYYSQGAENYTFDTRTFLNFELASQFPILPGLSSPCVNIGDLVAAPDGVGEIAVAPSSIEVAAGRIAGGSLSDLAESDDVDMSFWRDPTSTSARAEFILSATSPIASPTKLEFSIEAAKLARSSLIQVIYLYNYQSGEFEEFDRSQLFSPSDVVVSVTTSLDLSRYIDSITREVKAKIEYVYPFPRGQFSANVDQVIWVVE